MGTFAQSLPNSGRQSAWIWEFLKEELVPYPGRAALVGRMVTAATLSMLITMTFHLPYGAYCAIYSLSNFARKHPANGAHRCDENCLLFSRSRLCADWRDDFCGRPNAPLAVGNRIDVRG